MLNGHGGNIYSVAARLGCPPSEIVDMSSNVNPTGPPRGLLAHLSRHLDRIRALPEVDSHGIVELFARRYAVPPTRVVPGNGTTELIYALPRTLKSRKALIVAPTYADYADACFLHGVPFRYWTAREVDGFSVDPNRLEANLADVDTVFVCNPNNPTGAYLPADLLEAFCRGHTRVTFIVDESYLPFAPAGESASMLHRNLPNVIVLSSLSKIFGIPGLRIGFATLPSEAARRLGDYRIPWSVNTLAQQAVAYLFENKSETDRFIADTVTRLQRRRRGFLQTLDAHGGLRAFEGPVPFVLLQLPRGLTSAKVWEALALQRILVRNCQNFHGLSEEYIRISLKENRINMDLCGRLNALAKPPAPAGRRFEAS